MWWPFILLQGAYEPEKCLILPSLRWRQHDRRNKDRRKMEGKNEKEKKKRASTRAWEKMRESNQTAHKTSLCWNSLNYTAAWGPCPSYQHFSCLSDKSWVIFSAAMHLSTWLEQSSAWALYLPLVLWMLSHKTMCARWELGSPWRATCIISTV